MNEICTESRVECAECDGRLDASVSAVRKTETARAPDDPTDEIRWTQLGGPSKMSRDPIFHSSSCTTGPFQSNSIRRESTTQRNLFQNWRPRSRVQVSPKFGPKVPKMTEDRKKRFGNVSTAPKDVLRLRMFRLPCGQEAHL